MNQIKDILVINPGSTSTKIAVFAGDGEFRRFETNIVHDEAVILKFPDVASQQEYRKEMILSYLDEEGYELHNLAAVVGRGGMVYGLSGGGYVVTETLCSRMASSDIPQQMCIRDRSWVLKCRNMLVKSLLIERSSYETFIFNSCDCRI